jgi:hypothetical protein
MDLDGSNYKVLFSFYDTAGTSTVPAVTEGAHPIDSLAPQVHSDGSITFYGLTQEGGTADMTNTHGAGVIFAITVAPESSSVPNSTSVNLQLVLVTPSLPAASVTVTAQVSSPAAAVSEGTVSFTLAGQTVSAVVNGNGQATASLTLQPLTTSRPLTVGVAYSDAAGAFSGSSSSSQAPFAFPEAILPGTTRFDASGAAAVTDTIFSLLSLTRSYTAPGQLTDVGFNGLPLLTFQYNSQGQLTLVQFAGIPVEVLNYNAQGQLTSVVTPGFTSLFFYGAQGQLLGSVSTDSKGQVTISSGL